MLPHFIPQQLHATHHKMPTFSMQFLSTCLLLILLPSLSDSYETHLVEIASLLPSSICHPSSSSGEEHNGASFELFHKHGPCSTMDSSPLTTAQRLELDQVRAQSIQSATNRIPSAASSPTKHGAIAAAGDYIATIGLGTPKKNLNLVIDTGSDAVWTQCKKHAAFDPFHSSTYSNVSCERASCTAFTSMPGVTRGCEAATCTYAIDYSHKSSSEGFFAHDTLTISRESVPQFFFGCAQKSKGRFAGASGVLGLGRGSFSVNAQTEEKYGNVFSYCLPSKPSYVGRLTLEKGGITKSVKYTPLVKNPTHASKYVVEVIAISVGGVKLGIPPKVVAGSGTVVDSGVAITRLESGVYLTLSAVFGHAMAKYPMAKPLAMLNLCYNFKGFKYVSVPKISFFFKGGVEVPLHSSGILVGNGVERMCLAFAASENETDVPILGNVQQRTLDVVYDVGREKIGFGVNGCR